MKRRLYFAAALGLGFLASTATACAQGVRAETGGVAIGGNVSGSTINIGVPQEKIDALVKEITKPFEQLTAAQKETIDLLKGKLDLSFGQIRAALEILGEKDIPAEPRPGRLVEVAERFKALQATVLARPGDDPKIATLKADAQKAIAAGELAKSDVLLASVEVEQRRELFRIAIVPMAGQGRSLDPSVGAADTLGQRGNIAMTRLRYGEAANHFANAAVLFAPGSGQDDKRIFYLEREAAAFYKQGDEFGDSAALRSAIERYKRLLALRPRARVPLDWARTQNDLASALTRLGERETDAAQLNEAVAAYREALKERTRERAPRDWADTQNGLGTALSRLGERETDAAQLNEAVAAYREALKERTRERAPFEWAETQTNLGNALYRLGRNESSTARLHEAGAREHGVVRLHEAVVAYREALKERTRERTPLAWAATQHYLGNALLRLSRLERDTVQLQKSVAAYGEALKERTRARVPRDWATTTGNQGLALVRLAERTGNRTTATTAVAQIEAALQTLRAAGTSANASSYEDRDERYQAELEEGRAFAERLRRP
jgi:tetratricopeptide (TPR) repeat protein